MQASQEPLFTHLLAQQWADAAQTPKPTALNTMLRYSGAHGCGRRMGYDWFDAHYSDPPTPASVFQAGVGTLVGEAAANAMIAKYGGVAELPSQINDWISGSADWASNDDPRSPSIGRTVYEHKMKSDYAFNKALGYKRGFGKASFTDPAGAPRDAIVQGGLNVLGIEKTYGVSVDALVVGVVSVQIVSVKENRLLDVSDFARFGAEWVIPREIWEPRALRELSRLGEFAEMMDLGYIPDRIALDDNSERVTLSPGGDNFPCPYCPYRALCSSDGKGQVKFSASHLVKRTK